MSEDLVRARLVEDTFGCESFLDVGCGRGKYTQAFSGKVKVIALDAFWPYLEAVHYADVRICGRLQEVLPLLASGSVDAVVATDVIEHLTKNEALRALEHMRRIARRVVVVFTPLGFHWQEADILGEGADEWQTHRSGWQPQEFAALGFVVEFWIDFDHGKDATPGAIWAVLRKDASCQ